MAPSVAIERKAIIPNCIMTASGLYFVFRSPVSVLFCSASKYGRFHKILTINSATMIRKWVSVLKPIFVISSPIKAPVNPAKLQAPWKEDMIDLPYISSANTHSVFTEILHTLPATPYKKRDAPKYQAFGDKAIGIRIKA